MDTRERIRKSFKKLVQRGETINQEHGWDGDNYRRFPSNDLYLRFRTEALNLIRRTCGADSDHYLELRRLAEEKGSANNGSYFAHCFGILAAAQHDFEE